MRYYQVTASLCNIHSGYTVRLLPDQAREFGRRIKGVRGRPGGRHHVLEPIQLRRGAVFGIESDDWSSVNVRELRDEPAPRELTEDEPKPARTPPSASTPAKPKREPETPTDKLTDTYHEPQPAPDKLSETYRDDAPTPPAGATDGVPPEPED